MAARVCEPTIPSIGPAEMARRASATCASRKLRTGRSIGGANAATFVEGLINGGGTVATLVAARNGAGDVFTVSKFVIATGKRFVTTRLVVGGGVTGLVARFVSMTKFVLNQFRRLVARETSRALVTAVDLAPGGVRSFFHSHQPATAVKAMHSASPRAAPLAEDRLLPMRNLCRFAPRVERRKIWRKCHEVYATVTAWLQSFESVARCWRFSLRQ